MGTIQLFQAVAPLLGGSAVVKVSVQSSIGIYLLFLLVTHHLLALKLTNIVYQQDIHEKGADPLNQIKFKLN